MATLLSLHLELLSPQGDSLPDITRELWQRAESAQCRICGGWKADAEDAVDRMVQHILRLASRADWFRLDLERRELAIEETVICNALGWTVASQQAQDAFRPLWRRDTMREIEGPSALRQDDRPPRPSLDMAPRYGGELERHWLLAWKRWLHDS